MNNKLCQLLKVRYPIIQAAMAYISGADLAAAVSNAGGLGTIGPNPGPGFRKEVSDVNRAGELLRAEIERTRTLTDKPFAVNFAIGRGRQAPFTDRFVEVGIEERVPVAIVTMGSPDVYTERLKKAGCVVLQAVGCVKHAINAERAGVDGVICEGYEGGGHLGGEELPTFVLIPQVRDAVKVPVVAGGGIADARGFIAAMALGADGVYMGTRFVATHECTAHPAVKQALTSAADTSTVAFGRTTGLSRCLRNEYTKQHQELEQKGASFEQLREYERSGTPELKGRRPSVGQPANGGRRRHD